MIDCQDQILPAPQSPPERANPNSEYMKWHNALQAVVGQLENDHFPASEQRRFFDGAGLLGILMDKLDLWGSSPVLEDIERRLLSPGTNPSQAVDLARELVQARPFAGQRVLEIGGPFAQLLHVLGADSVTCVDPQIGTWPYNPERSGYQTISDIWDFREPFDLFEDPSFTLTISSRLLSMGSRLYPAYGKKGDLGDVWSSGEVFQGFLDGCALLTERDGLTFHVADKGLIPDPYKSPAYYQGMHLDPYGRYEMPVDSELVIFKKE